MGLASAAQPFNWNWVDTNGNTGLDVMGSVYDETLQAIVAQIPMKHVLNGMYTGSFQGVQGRNYSVQSSVYTDTTYQFINPAFPPGGESFQVAQIASSGGGGGGSPALVGIISATKLIGVVPPLPLLQAKVRVIENIKTC